MEDEQRQTGESIGDIHKRREMMADERRYIIYYTFGEDENPALKKTEAEEKKNV